MSLADLIVLAGCAAVEQAARDAGCDVQVPFTPGRTDASQEQTDVEAFAVLEPIADGFRNYLAPGHQPPAEQLLIERAFMLTLTAPEMTVLVGGMRALDANARAVRSRRLHQAARCADQRLLRQPARHEHRVAGPPPTPRRSSRAATVGRASARGPAAAWTCVFGSNSQLRALAEVYASDDAREKFVRDFVAAWVKVMNLDRFDRAGSRGSGRPSSAGLALSV